MLLASKNLLWQGNMNNMYFYTQTNTKYRLIFFFFSGVCGDKTFLMFNPYDEKLLNKFRDEFY